MLLEVLNSLNFWQLVLLFGCLALAFGFEMVNGFHDTANAVATVIYTRAMRPTPAVVWSGLCNMAGIFLGGIGVAFTVVRLLPPDMLTQINTNAGISMVVALLGAAILWNFGTWYLGLPASSSHALIGSILGVGIFNSLLAGHGPTQGVNLTKLGDIGLALLISPLIGFGLSATMLLLLKRLAPNPKLHSPPGPDGKPPWWIRGVLFTTCTGVSFAHGSNDGQKGMGLVMLILIGIVPTHFALNLEEPKAFDRTLVAAEQIESVISNAIAREAEQPRIMPASYVGQSMMYQPSGEKREAQVLVGTVLDEMTNKHSFAEIPGDRRWDLRNSIFGLDNVLKKLEVSERIDITPRERSLLKAKRAELRGAIEYVPKWVIIAVALCLGLGTMVGWKRIVVTVGEKIGKSHLTYGQGASAELVAMTTIGIADAAGLPVSTTHVLSSGVAGSMWANRSGVNASMVKTILLAWLLTLPCSMLLAGALLVLTRGAFALLAG